MLSAAFSEFMGVTNIVIQTWNAGGQITEVRILDALDVRAPEPEPVMVDPKPDIVNPESTAAPDIVDPESMEDQKEFTERGMLAIRMWSGFEPESITDAQLLASLGLDYPDVDIPNWVMTKLGVLIAKGDVTVDEFMLALQYVLEHA